MSTSSNAQRASSIVGIAGFKISKGFIYMVSNAAITGAKKGISAEQIAYFERIAAMNLSTPRLIGFGISNHETFTQATTHAKGAIIGSAFIKHLTNKGTKHIDEFVDGVLGKF